MNDILNATEAAKVIGCARMKVCQRMKRGLWDIGRVLTKKETGKKKDTYEVNKYLLAKHLGIDAEEIERRLDEDRERT